MASQGRSTDRPLAHPDCFFISGEWVAPTSDEQFDVLDSGNEELFFSVPAAQAADMHRAITAARETFDNTEWSRLQPKVRAGYLREIAAAVRRRSGQISQIWPRQSGVLFQIAEFVANDAAGAYDYYADLAETFEWEQPATPTAGGAFGMIVREAVGVVGAIVPWNGPLPLIAYKVAPAILAGCTVVLKASPEAPGEAYVMAEIAEEIGLPAGVLNVVTADREVSELLVRDHRVDKIAFTGSTAAGRTIAGILAERIGRYTLELGGKSAAIILDDADLEQAAQTLAGAETLITGQVCSSLTRMIVSRDRHDEFVEALAGHFSSIKVGDPFDDGSQMGPLAVARQRDRVEEFIAAGIADGAQLVTGGKRPEGIDRGYFIEPTVFGNVNNASTIAQNEIFGPVLSVIPVESEEDAIRTANDTIYGLNASVFSGDVDRALAVGRRLRSGTVGHNAWRSDFGVGFGGYKQSGVGREGGRDGLLPYLEAKTVILEETPTGYSA